MFMATCFSLGAVQHKQPASLSNTTGLRKSVFVSDGSNCNVSGSGVYQA